MSTITGTLRKIIQDEMRSLHIAELGLVEDVYPHSAASDKDNYGCDVRLKNSGLLLKRVPVATGHIGTVAIPNQGDLVLVAFEGGDVNGPLIIGRLYNDQDRPPLSKPNEIIFRLPLAEADDKTIKGEIRNHDQEREMLIEMAPKIKVRLSDGVVRAKAGETEMTLDQTGQTGGTVTVTAGSTKITMNQDGDITVDGAGSITMKAAKDMKFQAGTNIELQAGGAFKVQAGSTAEIQAAASAKLQAGASATFRAATIAINGVTSFGP